MAEADWINSVKTLPQARDFVLKVGVCGILKDSKGGPSLWEAVDAPDKVPGEAGWGKKMELVWPWKNELPATYPHEIFYGKRKAGAMLCSMPELRKLYAASHVEESALSATARKLLASLKQGPANNKDLRVLTGMSGKESKPAFDKALAELQLAFQIVRVNRMDTDGDTWTLFTAQYPEFN